MRMVSLADDDEHLTWQDRWEQAALAERHAFENMTAAELLAFVRQGRVGNYYNLWYVIAEKCSLEEAGELLLDVAKNASDELVRYHALAALGKMLGLKEKDDRIHPFLVREYPVQPKRLLGVRTVLEKMLAPHGQGL